MPAPPVSRRVDSPQSPEDAYFTAVRNAARQNGLYCYLMGDNDVMVATHNPEDLKAIADPHWIITVSGDLHPADTLSAAVGFILERHYGWTYTAP